jgi:hypothetical protein
MIRDILVMDREIINLIFFRKLDNMLYNLLFIKILNQLLKKKLRDQRKKVNVKIVMIKVN